jgi:hypothetical protein
MTITKRNNRSVKQGSMSSSKALKHEALCSHENSLSGSSWSKGCTPLCRTNEGKHGCGLQLYQGCSKLTPPHPWWVYPLCTKSGS